MSRAEPALVFALMISVIAPLRRPPSVARSRIGMLICPPARVGGCWKRSARRLRRSTICRLAAIPKNGTNQDMFKRTLYALLIFWGAQAASPLRPGSLPDAFERQARLEDIFGKLPKIAG